MFFEWWYVLGQVTVVKIDIRRELVCNLLLMMWNSVFPVVCGSTANGFE